MNAEFNTGVENPREVTMKAYNRFGFNRFSGALSVLFVLALKSIAPATTHVVQFGGAFGFSYSPKSFNCSVGDTVKWEGSFSSHPLTSTTIPAGAASWHVVNGSTFIYAVTAAGVYNYICDFHVGSGMTGQFTASPATSVEDGARDLNPQSHELDQNYPNPFNPVTTIRFSLPVAKYTVLRIYNPLGNEAETLVNGFESAGSHTVEFDGSLFPSGVYYYRLQTDGFSAVRRLTLIK